MLSSWCLLLGYNNTTLIIFHAKLMFLLCWLIAQIHLVIPYSNSGMSKLPDFFYFKLKRQGTTSKISGGILLAIVALRTSLPWVWCTTAIAADVFSNTEKKLFCSRVSFMQSCWKQFLLSVLYPEKSEKQRNIISFLILEECTSFYNAMRWLCHRPSHLQLSMRGQLR